MFEAGFTCILSKSLMNTRTRKELRAEKLVVLFVLYLVLSGLEVGAVVNEAPFFFGFCP